MGHGKKQTEETDLNWGLFGSRKLTASNQIK